MIELIYYIAAGLAGSISHELAHWAVWKVGGRDPQLNLWGLEVVPRAGPAHGTTVDKWAGVAPYLLGVTAVGAGAYSRTWLLFWFGVSMVMFGSKADAAAVSGDVTWKTLAD